MAAGGGWGAAAVVALVGATGLANLTQQILGPPAGQPDADEVGRPAERGDG
ncbi:hypothetical protein [Micromonospora zingiberis]|uniref:hypothetical protein n=1 Tax=Micromonospora zingiberis TaxID=2053011 RepID=UPI0013F3C412|nr:hypothetical protein [Micromonospora zingiberis]